MLDLIFWIMPEVQIFGETVRDLLVCDDFFNLNIILTKPVNKFQKKMQKLRDSLEIHGYILKIESTQSYQNSWPKFETNFIRYGITQGTVQKIGDLSTQLRLYLMTPEKMEEFQPIFRCNLLKMDHEGTLSMIRVPSTFCQTFRLVNRRVDFLNQILSDIYGKKATPIVPIKIRSGFEDRFYRSKLIYTLIELMEKGWEPNTFTLEDCGFDLTIAQINNYRASFKYPQIRKIYHSVLLDDQNINGISDSNEDLCPICHDQLVNSSIIRLKCDHLFHNHCIYQHFHKIGSNSGKCPVCRAKVIREYLPPSPIRDLSSSSSSSSSYDGSTEIDGEYHSDEIDNDLEQIVDQAVENAVTQAVAAINQAVLEEVSDRPNTSIDNPIDDNNSINDEGVD